MNKVTHKEQNELTIWVTSDCPECNGEGQYESGPECSRPASECCGGCYKTYLCDCCDGGGKVMTTLTPEILGELVDLLLYREFESARALLIDNCDIDEGQA